MSLPRVLLVEDDASTRRFVELALEDLPIQLCLTATLAQARSELAVAPVDLVLSDMMLPDGSGADLLVALHAQRAGGNRPRLVVFSAGITAHSRQLLLAQGVDEVLAKPVSLANLARCVQQVLQPLQDDVALAVDNYFGGNRALFDAYRAGCFAQFPEDLREGDAAAVGGDWPTLRRLAHSLKTVLLTLGDPTGSAQAARTEADAALPAPEAAAAGWQALRAHLQRA